LLHNARKAGVLVLSSTSFLTSTVCILFVECKI
jgi:hypothetical protein